jgi:hypothetical protein
MPPFKYPITINKFVAMISSKEDGMLRTMVVDKLLKTLPILHQQLEALLHFDIQPNELTNSIINSCFVLLSKDLIRLFACYNDGVINLLGRSCAIAEYVEWAKTRFKFIFQKNISK